MSTHEGVTITISGPKGSGKTTMLHEIYWFLYYKGYSVGGSAYDDGEPMIGGPPPHPACPDARKITIKTRQR
jgi:hypothetical protein